MVDAFVLAANDGNGGGASENPGRSNNIWMNTKYSRHRYGTVSILEPVPSYELLFLLIFLLKFACSRYKYMKGHDLA